jgi:hypothetical protein
MQVQNQPGNLDRLMNWVVGALLLVGVAIVVAIQVHPPV